jgi:hypothetical protein
MSTNLLGLAAIVCVVVATAGLAGPLWALLLLGCLLAGMTWVSHLNDDTQALIHDAVAAAIADQAKTAELDKDMALADAANAAAFALDQAVATERERADAAGIAPHLGAPPLLPLLPFFEPRNGKATSV